MEDSKLNEIAIQAANSMLIKPKPNTRIPAAKKKFGKIVDEILKMKSFKLSDFSNKEQKIIKKLLDIKYSIIYEKNGIYYPRPQEGETIRLIYYDQPECKKLANFLREECWRRGCTVQFVPVTDESNRKALEITPEWALAGRNKLVEEMTKHIDVRFIVGYEEDPLYSKGLEDKKRLGAPFTNMIRKIQDKKATRWCWLAWPVLLNEKAIPIPAKEYKDIFLESIDYTFTPEVEKIVDYYGDALEGADKIRITADDGTDFSFSIKCRPILRSKGFVTEEDIKNGDYGLNIPDGEVYVAPLETTANGKICFDYAMPHGFGLIRNLWLTFKDGKVVNYSADGDGTKVFKKFLDSNTGEKDRIAELGIGCNPKAVFNGSTMVNEKIFGSIHIAIGYNQGSYHGKNMASSHEDFVKVMKGKNGNLYVDGKIVMKDGRPNY